jgi:hypothetical protein
MAGILGYADAVRLLAGPEGRALVLLDQLAGGLLRVGSAGGWGLAVSLFDRKAELARLGRDVVAGLGGRLAGLGRFDRSERIAAAHAVIVVAGYFEVLAEVELPFELGRLDLTGADQILLLGGSADSGRLPALAQELLRADVPLPGPQSPYETTLEVLGGFYRELSAAVLRFIAGCAVWDEVEETGRERLRHRLHREVPDLAVARYEVSLRRLAVDCPEVAFWTNLVDHQATRADIRSLRRSLAGLERLLAELSEGRAADDRRAALARAHQAVLARPILDTGEVPEGLRFPSLEDGYVNPDYRVATVTSTDDVAEEHWWQSAPARHDLQGFLLGHLTSLAAAVAPLLVLGQPGSGKSSLTRVLAARLPPQDFLVVRVALREVPADADVQTQIEHGIRSATGEQLSWPELSRTARGALPVVLLDGFDELLQATGVSQTDYLERVARFQRREADQGRPVVAVVTSRTAVADRATAPPGMAVLRLEPFSGPQVERWLRTWNATNAAYFEQHRLQSLSVRTLRGHGELACQPLLLLMLALYDAEGNRLQREDAELSHADLYERLLTRFAQREVRRTSAAVSPAWMRQETERELLRLALAAFAIANRRRQWATETELNADLAVLLEEQPDPPRRGEIRAPLSAAEIVIGRFFFVHEAQAIRDNAELRTFEFLHATFGEYLIARLVCQELQHLVAAAELDVGRTRGSRTGDAFLYALLSFSCLATRDSTVAFLGQLLSSSAVQDRRERYRGYLLTLFRAALQPRLDTHYADYTPATRSVPSRHAAWSANLLLMIVLSTGQVSASELFAGTDDPTQMWYQTALLWRSQLHPGWTALSHTLHAHRTWDGDRQDLRIQETADQPTPPVDPYWTYDHGPTSDFRPAAAAASLADRPGWSWVHGGYDGIRRKQDFVRGRHEDILAHALEPLEAALGSTIVTFHGYWPDRCVSAANALIALLLTSAQHTAPADLAAAYDTCLQIAIWGFAPNDTETVERYTTIVLNTLRADLNRLPPAWVHTLADHIDHAGEKNGPVVRTLTHQILSPSIAALGD